MQAPGGLLPAVRVCVGSTDIGELLMLSTCLFTEHTRADVKAHIIKDSILRVQK